MTMPSTIKINFLFTQSMLCLMLQSTQVKSEETYFDANQNWQPEKNKSTGIRWRTALVASVEANNDNRFAQHIAQHSLKYYPSNLSYKNGPFKEQEFLSRSNIWQLDYGHWHGRDGLQNTDGRQLLLKHRFHLGRNLALFGEIFTSNYEDLSATGIELGLGRYLSDTTLISTSFHLVNEDLANGSTNIFQTRANYRKLFYLRWQHCLALELGIKLTQAENESNKYYQVTNNFSSEYYFNRRWSMGLGFQIQESDYDVDDTSNIAFQLNYQHSLRFGFATEIKVQNHKELPGRVMLQQKFNYSF